MAFAIDLSGLGTFMPVFGFVLIFTVVYALLGKTKVLGEQKFVHIFVSFCVAIVFLISTNAVEYVKVTTPIFAATPPVNIIGLTDSLPQPRSLFKFLARA